MYLYRIQDILALVPSIPPVTHAHTEASMVERLVPLPSQATVELTSTKAPSLSSLTGMATDVLVSLFWCRQVRQSRATSHMRVETVSDEATLPDWLLVHHNKDPLQKPRTFAFT